MSNDFTSIDNLPTNPQNSAIADHQPPVVMPNQGNNQNVPNAMQDSLEFPNEYNNDMQNIVIDPESNPSYYGNKEDISQDKKVQFNVPDQVRQYHPENPASVVNKQLINNSNMLSDPTVQFVIMAGLLFFIFQNPVIHYFGINFIGNYMNILDDKSNLNLTGQIIFSIMFISLLLFIIKTVDISSFHITF